MTLRRMTAAFAVGFGGLALALPTALLLFTATGCSKDNHEPTAAPPAAGTVVVGTLVAVKDDRPADGGIDLTLQTVQGVRELVLVPSIHMAPPRDAVQAMHQVADASKIGDRLRAIGTRDETGALRAEVLERITR